MNFSFLNQAAFQTANVWWTLKWKENEWNVFKDWISKTHFYPPLICQMWIKLQPSGWNVLQVNSAKIWIVKFLFLSMPIDDTVFLTKRSSQLEISIDMIVSHKKPRVHYQNIWLEYDFYILILYRIDLSSLSMNGNLQ